MTAEDERINEALHKILGLEPIDTGGNIECLEYPDYKTNEGYGKLIDVYDGWEESKQKKFLELAKSKIIKKVMENTDIRIVFAFHKDNFAPLMLEFLKQEG